MSNATFRHQSRASSKYSLKNKSTGDWFSHIDNSNSLAGSTIAKLLAGSQFESEEVRNNKSKIAGGGNEGKWYKHDDNRSYRDPVRSRLPSADGRKIKEMHGNSFNRISPDEYNQQIFVRSGAHREEVAKNCNKIRGGHDTPQWFVHPENVSPVSNGSPDFGAVKTRLTTDEAFYYRDRNKLGNTPMWAEDDDEAEMIQRTESDEWRPETRTGQHPRAESELWFHHEEFKPDQKNSYSTKQYSTQTVRETVEKSRGVEMLKILQQLPAGNETLKILQGRRKSTQRQATDSTVQYVLNQSSNGNYKEPIRCPRAVKPEGMEIFKKNKDGTVGQFLSGYPDQAYKKEIHKIVNVDEELLKKHKGVNMAMALIGELPPTGRNLAPRAVRPEAEKNAERNKGTMKDILVGVTRGNNNNNSISNNVDFTNNLNLRSREAREIARKYYHGSVHNLFC